MKRGIAGTSGSAGTSDSAGTSSSAGTSGSGVGVVVGVVWEWW